MKPEDIQEHEYNFPYHHLITLKPFGESSHLFWGYRYAAYIEAIIETLQKFSWHSLIDIGCGDGKVALELAKQFPKKRIVGLDFSEKSLAFAQAFAPNIEFTTTTTETFDFFILVEVLEHIPPATIDTFLLSICTKVKPGGVGIITVPHVNVPVISKHYQHFSKESITKVLEKYFEIITVKPISAQTLGTKLIQMTLANRFFILNWQPLINKIYARYKRKYFFSSEKNAQQLFVIIRKKD